MSRSLVWSLFLCACAPLEAGLQADAFDSSAGSEEAFPGARIEGSGVLEVVTGPDSSVIAPYVIQSGYAVTGGDIRLATADEVGLRAAIAGTDDKRWPCTVPFSTHPELPAKSRADFLDAVAYWEANTPLRFVEDDTAVGRLEVRDSTGCSSWVGRRDEDVQGLWLGATCGFGAARHELGHAMGLYHEQARLDAEEHVTIHWDRIQPKYQFAFRTWEQRGDQGIDVGDYDIGSLMQYGSGYFKVGGRCSAWDTSGCTITTLDGGFISPQREQLSASDLEAVQFMYGHCAEEGAPPPAVPMELPWEEQVAFELAEDGVEAQFVLTGPTEVIVDVSLDFFGSLESFELQGDAGVVATSVVNEFGGNEVVFASLEAGTYTVVLRGAGAASAWIGPGRVHGYADDPADPEWQAVMELVNTGDLEVLDVTVGLDSRAATAIHEQFFGVRDLRELDGLAYVGASAFDALYTHVRAN